MCYFIDIYFLTFIIGAGVVLVACIECAGGLS